MLGTEHGVLLQCAIQRRSEYDVPDTEPEFLAIRADFNNFSRAFISGHERGLALHDVFPFDRKHVREGETGAQYTYFEKSGSRGRYLG